VEKFRVLDLFSGIGSFSLGLERTGGFETAAFCEIDPHCQKVLKKHWPDTHIFPDVKKLRYEQGRYLGDGKYEGRENIDVIVGGFPCTDVSVAGKKKGLIDEEGKETRSGLWFEYRRLIEEIRPKYVIIENVANLRNKGLGRVIKDLWALGYMGEWHIVSARSVGAPHLRERIWIIAYPRDMPTNTRSSGQSGIQPEGWSREEIRSRGDGQERIITHSESDGSGRNSNPVGEEKRNPEEQKVWAKPNSENEDNERDGRCEQRNCQGTLQEPPNTNNFRFWRSFATEEEKSQWWAEMSASQRSVFDQRLAPLPCVRLLDDGTSPKLELRRRERARKERIKQLGNSLLPQIPEIIGKEILRYELGRNRNK
jgi:DNA (cytosine-5)-methyltransferase 1